MDDGSREYQPIWMKIIDIMTEISGKFTTLIPNTVEHTL